MRALWAVVTEVAGLAALPREEDRAMLDGAVIVIDPDGQYRCLTMVSGVLELCPT